MAQNDPLGQLIGEAADSFLAGMTSTFTERRTDLAPNLVNSVAAWAGARAAELSMMTTGRALLPGLSDGGSAQDFSGMTPLSAVAKIARLRSSEQLVTSVLDVLAPAPVVSGPVQAKAIDLPDPVPGPWNPRGHHPKADWNTPTTPTYTLNADNLDLYGPQMKKWAMWSVEYANEAGVDADMVLAMVLQEGAPLRTGYRGGRGSDRNLLNALEHPETYDPHDTVGPLAGTTYDLIRMAAWWAGETKHPEDPDISNSIGLTNLKLQALRDTVRAYPDHFEGVSFWDLVGSDELAIKATAFNLRMFKDRAVPFATAEVRNMPFNQFLSSSYNAGGTWERSQEVAMGKAWFTGTPQNPAKDGSDETEHGQATIGQVLDVADQILYGSGAYK
ncbi:hypothetical protein [Nocardia inohanensis]|uniref:hypothetical protein n=1 Tax=Nocardia inohanensis TaxID=209246 RepID=UPI00082CA685|nr:hypothetical protein [Nocardia inohanensis]